MTSDKTNDTKLTPLMKQFYAVKEKHPDKILFFRMGDFYEMFGDDAVKAAPILNIALTSRSHGSKTDRIPLAGVPYHSAEKYLSKLMSAGEKVVVVEQVEDPKLAKGLVKRDIVEILTPGTATVETPDAETIPLCLAAVCENSKHKMGLAALDITTGSFIVDEGPFEDIYERLRVLEPSEIIYPENQNSKPLMSINSQTNRPVQLTSFGDWNFDFKTAERDLNNHFGTSTLAGFGILENKLALSSAGAIY